MTDFIKLKAPAGRTGQIHASASGSVYDIDGGGTVTVLQKDVGDLVRAGFVPIVDGVAAAALPAPQPSTFQQPSAASQGLAETQIFAQSDDVLRQLDDVHASQAADAIHSAAEQLHADNAAVRGS